MDAIEAAEYNITEASRRLGIRRTNLSAWIRNEDNLRNFVKHRIEMDAVKARDKLNEILSLADSLDPKQMGHVVNICKILLDKAEADKSQVDVTTHNKIDDELNEKIKKLLGNQNNEPVV